MILYYALGGGFGHITRGQALLHTLQIPERDAVILSSPVSAEILESLYYHTVPLPSGLIRDPASYASWIHKMFLRYRPTTFFVDTFPVGLFGELAGLDYSAFFTDWHYVSRIFRFSKYLKINNIELSSCQRFSTVWYTETVSASDEQLISSLADNSTTIDLIDPPSNDPCKPVKMKAGDRYWMIIHSGNCDEVTNLLLYTRRKQEFEGGLRPVLVVATDRMLNDGYLKQYHPLVTHCLKYPALDLMDGADRLISACGANIMRQTRTLGHKHDFMPMERAFDDQFLRAAYRRMQIL